MTEGTPEPPDHLTDAAKQTWRAFAAVYHVTIADIPLFEQFCDSYARYQQLIRKANETGPLVTIKGDVCTNPNLTRADREAANFKHALALMLRTQHGRPNADENDQEHTEQTEASAIEELRSRLLAHLTSGGNVVSGPAGDRQSDRDRSKKQTTPARPVRKKKETRSRTPTTEESDEP